MEMQRLQKKHLIKFEAVYSKDVCRPKHHYSLHLPLQWEAHSLCVDCFPAERKHRDFKKVAETLKRLDGFATSALLEMNHKDVSQHETRNAFHPVLRGPTAKCDALHTWFGQDAYVANSLECHGITFAAGQHKILSAQYAIEIYGAVECGKRFFLLCQPLQPVHASQTAMSHWKSPLSSDATWVLPIEQAVQAMPIYFFRKKRKDADNLLTFLHA